MKKLLLILFCLPMLLLAQAPQGFTYQGVATDNNGFELQNQNISIKASLLSSSATGAVVWQETHNTITDTFGLFNVTIGGGITTNGGSSATFSEIDWGAASHFMKVEVDVNGGSNYVHVGTSQMMSVPYALYAENVHNLNMDSILGAVYDSISSSNFSGSCQIYDLSYPQGLNGTVVDVVVPNGSSYTVPSDKNLYMLNATTLPNPEPIYINGIAVIYPHAYSGDWRSCVYGGNDVISCGQYGDIHFQGILVDKNCIESIIISLIPSNNYTVPSGKKLLIRSFNGNNIDAIQAGNYYTGNLPGSFPGNYSDLKYMFFKSGTNFTIVSSSGQSGSAIMNAILIDE